MKISIIGTGYVGLTTSVGLASKGHDVICLDIDRKKVDKINSGITPIFEEGMEGLLKQILEKKKLMATTDTRFAILNSDVSFIAVGTPSNDDGSMNLDYIKKASGDVGAVLKNKDSYHVFAVKSTVVPGTTEEIVKREIEKVSGKKAGKDFGLCMCPEFLKEGVALKDFLSPNRVVIGELDKKSGDVLEEIFKDFNSPVLRTQIKTAELIKYASNALLATKISFSNEIGNLCKKLGLDVYDVMKGVGMDDRINEKFLNAGCGYGGSCFPKDVKAIIKKAEEAGCTPKLLYAVEEVNEQQKKRIVEMAEEKLGDLSGKNFGLLGLAFKPGTDDIREGPALVIIRELLKRGCVIHAHDPKAMKNMRKVFPDINYHETPEDVLKNCEICGIVTDWPEFRDIDLGHFKNKQVFEGRKILKDGIVKEGICW